MRRTSSPDIRPPVAARALLLLAFSSAPALAAPDLAVHLIAGDAPGTVVLSLVNEGSAPVEVLRAGSALDAELAQDAFDVHRTRKGWPAIERPVYTGRLVKRPAPEPGDFLTIPPGGSVSNALLLERYYAVPETGDYTVRFDGTFGVRDGAPTAARPRGRAALVDVRPDAPRGADRVELELHPDASYDARARPPDFNGCSAGQRDDIVEAIGAAESITADALRALRNTPASRRADAPRYARWFGAHTPERYSIVTDRYDAILDALSGETIAADCTCTEEVYAYVYASRPYAVYLCPYFFRADVLGTDSRAGTFVHELSHFTVLGGTRDHVYGRSSAATLAFEDPDLAVANADSVEYFAENTPALSMNGGASTDTPADDPPTPAPSAGGGAFAPLRPGAPVAGFVAEGEHALFRTSGVDTIVLDSITGDADLYVFADAGLASGSLVCSSAAGGRETDVCELPAGDIWYVDVVGYRDSEYEIRAAAVDLGGTAPGNGPADDDPFAVSGGGFGGASGEIGAGAVGGAWAGLLGVVAALRRRRSVLVCRPARAGDRS